ncbi:unnamed protein product [Ilex paraguariensis]|uniref:CBS domain-containing protein n=1 Tax=Ilex paraguariensis TaxID=185542 RepID=A0ABC8TCI1_9AQUA
MFSVDLPPIPNALACVVLVISWNLKEKAFRELSNQGLAPLVLHNDFQTYKKVQKLLSKTNGNVVGELMTPAPVVGLESANLKDAARLLLKTKFRRLPVVDSVGVARQ